MAPSDVPAGWFWIARSDEVDPAEVKALDRFGQPLVLWRSASGRPNLTEAHCPHLGAHLGYGGRVVGDTVECPFHGWRFDDAGRCVRIPYCTKIPKHARLNPFTVREFAGSLWASTAETPEASDLPVLPEYGAAGWSTFLSGSFEAEAPRDQLLRTVLSPELPQTTVEEVHTTAQSMGASFHFIAKTQRNLGEVSVQWQAHGPGIIYADIEAFGQHARAMITATPLDDTKQLFSYTALLERVRNPITGLIVKRLLQAVSKRDLVTSRLRSWLLKPRPALTSAHATWFNRFWPSPATDPASERAS